MFFDELCRSSINAVVETTRVNFEILRWFTKLISPSNNSLRPCGELTLVNSNSDFVYMQKTSYTRFFFFCRESHRYCRLITEKKPLYEWNLLSQREICKENLITKEAEKCMEQHKYFESSSSIMYHIPPHTCVLSALNGDFISDSLCSNNIFAFLSHKNVFSSFA